MSKPIDEEDEFEEFEQEDWDIREDSEQKEKDWSKAWEDADWDDEDPDDTFQQKLRDEIKRALEINNQSKMK